jgi:hypothetical protein
LKAGTIIASVEKRFIARLSPLSLMSCASSAFAGDADFFNQLRGLGVLAAVVALLADQQQNPPVLLGLGFEQINRVADGVENRRAARARLQMLERLVDLLAGVREVADQMRLGVEAHQRRLALAVAQKEIEQRPQLGQLAELQHAHPALLDRDHQRHRRGIHLLLHANLLRHAVVFENEIPRLEAVDHAPAALLHQRGHQHLVGRHTQRGCGGVGMDAGQRLRRLNGGQLLRADGCGGHQQRRTRKAK